MLMLILRDGFKRKDRTGTGTIGVFGHQAKFDLRDGFPLITTKKMHLKSIIYELLWFLRGDTNTKWLHENGAVRIWDEWADENGDLGRVYGAQWRDWRGPNGEHIDQIKDVMERIRTKPDDRRLIVTAWQPAELDKMALPPCHCFFQFSTQELPAGNRRLHLQMYQRSCDTFLGVPFNIAGYALLLQMVAVTLNMEPGVFTHTYGDLHLYMNHLEQVDEQLSRELRPLPRMNIRRRDSIFDYEYEDFELVDYNPWPAIKAPVSV